MAEVRLSACAFFAAVVATLLFGGALTACGTQSDGRASESSPAATTTATDPVIAEAEPEPQTETSAADPDAIRADMLEYVCESPAPTSFAGQPSGRHLHAFVCREPSIRDHIDPERGVLLIVAKTDAPPGDVAEGGPEVRRAVRLCGGALESFVSEFPGRFVLDAVNDLEGGYIQCSNSGECRLPAITEWETEDLLVFSQHPSRGMVLSAVVELETLLVSPEMVEERSRWAARQRRRLARGRCP